MYQFKHAAPVSMGGLSGFAGEPEPPTGSEEDTPAKVAAPATPMSDEEFFALGDAVFAQFDAGQRNEGMVLKFVGEWVRRENEVEWPDLQAAMIKFAWENVQALMQSGGATPEASAEAVGKFIRTVSDAPNNLTLLTAIGGDVQETGSVVASYFGEPMKKVPHLRSKLMREYFGELAGFDWKTAGLAIGGALVGLYILYRMSEG